MSLENSHVCAQNAENGFGFNFFQSDTTKVAMKFSVTLYVGWNFNSGNYLFTTDTK
jgi:hypothetical protein